MAFAWEVRLRILYIGSTSTFLYFGVGITLGTKIFAFYYIKSKQGSRGLMNLCSSNYLYFLMFFVVAFLLSNTQYTIHQVSSSIYQFDSITVYIHVSEIFSFIFFCKRIWIYRTCSLFNKTKLNRHILHLWTFLFLFTYRISLATW